MIEKVILVAWTIAAIIGVFLIRKQINKRFRNLTAKIIFIIVEFILFVLIALLVMTGPSLFVILHFPLTGIYVALFGDMIFAIIYEIFIRLRKYKPVKKLELNILQYRFLFQLYF